MNCSKCNENGFVLSCHSANGVDTPTADLYEKVPGCPLGTYVDRSPAARAQRVLEGYDPQERAVYNCEKAHEWAKFYHYYKKYPEYNQNNFYSDLAFSECKNFLEWTAVWALIWLLSK